MHNGPMEFYSWGIMYLHKKNINPKFQILETIFSELPQYFVQALFVICVWLESVVVTRV